MDPYICQYHLPILLSCCQLLHQLLLPRLVQILSCHVKKENFIIHHWQKGDANDGKPDAFRISKSEKVQIWLEFQYYGWFGMDFENILAELPKEARGQS